MPFHTRPVTIGILTVLSLGAVMVAQPASAGCRDLTVREKGAEKAGIEDAQVSASEALGAKIRWRYGKTWTAGSHRNGSFHCDKVLGYRTGWTCSAQTTRICAP